MPRTPRFQVSTTIPLLGALLIAAAACFALSSAFHGNWLWDDFEISDDSNLRSLAGLARIWFAPTTPDYAPVKSLFLWVEWHLWGDNLFLYHVANAGMHALAAILLWRVLVRFGVKLAWLGGLIFVVHPLTVESAAWISEIKNTLSLVLLLWGFLAYLDWDEGRPWKYTLALILFLAAMLAKASVVMFPAVLLLHAWWRRGRIDRRDVRAATPFLAVSVALGIVTVWLQVTRAISHWNLPHETFMERIAGAGLAIRFYLGKCLFPSNLMPIYPGWRLHPLSASLFLPWGILGALVIVLIRVAMASGRFRAAARAFLFGLGWFVLNLFPVLGFLPMSYQHVAPVADHFCYLSLAGLVGLAVAGLGSLPAPSRPAVWIVAAGVVAGLAVQSRRYAALFIDQETLWAYNLAHNQTSRAVRVNEGFILHHDGRDEEAIRNYEEAIRLDPEDAQAEEELATIHLGQNRSREAAEHFSRAISHYERALEIDPSRIETRRSLAKTLANSGRRGEAIREYERILKERPDDAETENNLGKALAEEGRTAEAIGHIKKALALSPDFAEAENSLGMALLSQGRQDEGMRHLERAIRLEPRLAEAQNNLGLALVRAGRPLDAIPHIRTALELQPGLHQAENNLGYALAAAGRSQEAVSHFEKALRLVPTDAGAHLNLGVLLEILGRPKDAIPHLEQAIRLRPDLEAARRELERISGQKDEGGNLKPEIRHSGT